MRQPTRLLSNELRDQPEGKATRWAAFCVFWEDCLVSERVFMPDCTYFLVPELTEPGRGEQPSSCPNGCLFLMSPPAFSPKHYILTRRKRWILDVAVCSATSVESCLCLKVPREFPRGKPLLWAEKTIELPRFLSAFEGWKLTLFPECAVRNKQGVWCRKRIN